MTGNPDNWGPRVPNPDFWREAHCPSTYNPACECAGQFVCCPCTLRDALKELARLRSSHARLLEALMDLLDYVDRNACRHENVYRGGVIWTICPDCGHKWADDEGGFQPYEEPPPVVRARAAIAAAEGGE